MNILKKMQAIIKPQSIKKGNTIALIAPAGPITEEQLQKACIRIESLGFNVLYNDRVLHRKGYLAGDDHSRLAGLHEAFANKKADLVLCIRGGYGCGRFVDKIDYDLIKHNPKIFIGFSDITVLLNAIWSETGLVTFHGVIGNSAFPEFTRRSFLEILSSQTSGYKIYTHDPSSLGIISEGKASGQLICGNLSIINSLIGTKYEMDLANKIVFIEDIDEAPYRIDRMLTQLLLTGKLQKAAGIILGDFKGCDNENNPDDQKKSLSLSQVFSDRLGELKIPVLTGFSFGHIEHQAIFPIGIKAEIDTAKPYINLLENVVE